MDGMKRMSDATKALGAVKLEAIPYDPAVIRRAARVLSRRGAAMRGQFPAGFATGKSEALPVIWTDRAGFDALFDELDAAAADEPRAMRAADAVAEAFKRCHEKYRAKKL